MPARKKLQEPFFSELRKVEEGWKSLPLKLKARRHHWQAWWQVEPHRWAGTKHQSLVHLQIWEDTEAAQDAKIFCDSRAFRFASVKWWQNNLSPEVERADAEGMALSIVEDDRLVKGLQDLAAKACSEEGFKDCLDQGFKCETDRWEGHVIWFGPKAVEYFLGALQQDHPSVDLRWLEGQRELPAECAAHFVPFSHKTSRRACFSN